MFGWVERANGTIELVETRFAEPQDGALVTVVFDAVRLSAGDRLRFTSFEDLLELAERV